jgi:hypothetical protein
MSHLLHSIRQYSIIFLAGFSVIIILNVYLGLVIGEKPEFGYDVSIFYGSLACLMLALVFVSIKFICSKIFRENYTLKVLLYISFISYFIYFTLGQKIESYLFIHYSLDRFITMFWLSGLIFLFFLLVYSFGRKLFINKKS